MNVSYNCLGTGDKTVKCVGKTIAASARANTYNEWVVAQDWVEIPV